MPSTNSWRGKCRKTPAENAAPAANEETTEAVADDNADNPVSIEDLEHFGLEFTLDASIPAGTVLTNPDDYVGKTVRVTGKVSDVCQKMGCWMVITDADQHMRITTKDLKFFVSKDGAGATCDLEGTVVKREASPARTEHFKSEQSEELQFQPLKKLVKQPMRLLLLQFVLIVPRSLRLLKLSIATRKQSPQNNQQDSNSRRLCLGIAFFALEPDEHSHRNPTTTARSQSYSKRCWTD